MSNCIMHIGFGKTGTSSLQAYLTDHPYVSGSQHKYQYAAILRNGEVAQGARLSRMKTDSVVDYVVSVPDLDQVEALSSFPLKGVLASEVLPIFSQEDWARRGLMFHRGEALSKLGIKAEVIAYVRPQVEWFNSGWWQWWAWEPQFKKPKDVIEMWSLNFCKWYTQLKWWKDNPNVEKLTVRLQAPDIIGDFLGLLGANPEVDVAPYRQNTSLTPFEAKILKVLGKQIRQTGATDVDELIRRILPSTGATPWAVDTDCARQIIEGCRDDNLQLLSLLDEDQQTKMHADQRWWSAEQYESRDVFNLDEQGFTEDELKDVVQKLFVRLIQVERSARAP